MHEENNATIDSWIDIDKTETGIELAVYFSNQYGEDEGVDKAIEEFFDIPCNIKQRVSLVGMVENHIQWNEDPETGEIPKSVKPEFDVLRSMLMEALEKIDAIKYYDSNAGS